MSQPRKPHYESPLRLEYEGLLIAFWN